MHVHGYFVSVFLRTRNNHTVRFIIRTNLKYFGIFRFITVFETDTMLKIAKLHEDFFFSGSFCQILRVSLMRQRPQFGPTSFLWMLSLLLKALNFNHYFTLLINCKKQPKGTCISQAANSKPTLLMKCFRDFFLTQHVLPLLNDVQKARKWKNTLLKV